MSKKKTDYFHRMMRNRDGIFILLRSPRIDSTESIPPAFVAWAGRYDNPIPTRFP